MMIGKFAGIEVAGREARNRSGDGLCPLSETFGYEEVFPLRFRVSQWFPSQPVLNGCCSPTSTCQKEALNSPSVT